MTVMEVQQRRKELSIRQDALARKLGWNAETIVDIERGRIQVSEHTLRQMDGAIDQIEIEKGEEVIAA